MNDLYGMYLLWIHQIIDLIKLTIRRMFKRVWFKFTVPPSQNWRGKKCSKARLVAASLKATLNSMLVHVRDRHLVERFLQKVLDQSVFIDCWLWRLHQECWLWRSDFDWRQGAIVVDGRQKLIALVVKALGAKNKPLTGGVPRAI